MLLKKKADWSYEDGKIMSVIEAKETFERNDWAKLHQQIIDAIADESILSIDDMNLPAVNLYNEKDDAEMYIGFFEEDYFELSLHIESNDDEISTTDKKGLSTSDVLKAIELFYAEDYIGIERMIPSLKVKSSSVRKKLLDRETQAQALENKKGWQSLALLFAVILALVAWMMYQVAST